MSIHRYTVVIGVAGILFGLGMTHVHAQGPPKVESETPPRNRRPGVAPPVAQEDDAAATALRSLYVPDGLTSDQAVHQVVVTSPNMKRTEALLKDAKGGALQAMSGLVPRLELLARYSKLSPVETAGLTTGGDVPSGAVDDLVDMVQDPAAQTLWRGLTSYQFPSLTHQYATDATLVYSFTRSLAEAMPAYRAAKKSKVAAQYQIEAELNNVAFDGRQAYYEYARAEAGLGVANFALEAAVSQREETEALVGAGSAARVDLLRVQAQEEAARVAVEQAKLGVQVAARALQALMHTDELPTLGEDLSEPVTGIPTESEKTLQERAYAHRPDLLALRKYVEVTQHQLKSAKGGAAPDVLARGSVQYSNPNLRVVPQQDRFESTWEVGAVIRWRPNDTVAATGRARKLEADLERAYADVDLLEIAVRVEVAEGYHGMLAAQSAIESARLGLSAAREGYRVTREQLQAGIVNTTTLLQAQSELIRAQVDVVESAIGLRIAKAQLRRAIGERP
jgi:outer membrane protein TolC